MTDGDGGGDQTLQDLLERTERRKAELGIIDTDSSVEALRNKGAGRTPQKRELLRRADARAKAAGLKPVPGHY